MSMMKEYQLIVAALIIAGSIALFSNTTRYDYVRMGDTGVSIFRNGEIEGFCELAFDSCYYKDHGNEFWLKPINLRDVLEEAAAEDQQWRMQEQEILKERIK